MLKQVARGIELLENAIDEDDTSAVVKIGDIERKLDRIYRKKFRRHLKDVRKTANPEGVMASLFICHRIEEMGDVLLAISEFVISAKLGQQMQLDRFHALGAALSDAGLSDAEVELLAHTKSGGGISGISSPRKNQDGYLAVFKDGKRNKLDDERENVQSWHEIVPGLVPKILGYKKRGKSASLLIEHLPGLTFEQIVRQESDKVLRASLRRLTKTLRAVWSETKRSRKAPTEHMAQLRKRLPEVLRIHSDFETGRQRIGNTEVASLAQLVDAAQKLEPALAPPFSVFIHGDFNLDNIIYDQRRKAVHFIDVHRSRYLDYVQDVAVFMVSNYRLQVLEPSTRRRLADVAVSFYEFAAKFARANRDHRFELRLALALARSFITSARFVMDRAVARNLLLRGVYILQCVQGQNKKSAKTFRLPMQMLFR
jgi:aminoglycoside phosphotransferase